MINKNQNVSGQAYDEVPYTSYPFAQTNPAMIRAVAKLFGLDAPAVETARILEIGCAGGNNILSIAARYPKSTCVGIDLSQKQIEDGQKNVEALGIKNLKLQTLSIMDIDKKFGEFDYIISHGVFSWIPREVQEKHMEISSRNLSKNGVSYISYNTMPGWSAVQSIREMMLYHTERFPEQKTKAEQARLLLKFISDSLKNFNKSFYSDIIDNELNILNNQSDFYLLHEHLEENNIQYYFHQFIEMANKSGLQYLAETALSSMFIGNMPKETAAVLSTTDDIIRMEQYMDFINNRRFRSTLLCHKDRILRRNLNGEDLLDKYFSSSFKLPDNFTAYKYGSNVSLEFKSAGGFVLTTNDQLLIAAISVLATRKNVPMQLGEIVKAVLAKFNELGLKVEVSDDKVALALATSFLRNIFIGGITMHLDEGIAAGKAGTKPKAFQLASYQAGIQSWVTNLRQETININELDKALLPLLDGKNTIESLTEKLMKKFASQQLVMNAEGKKIEDEKLIREKLPEYLRHILERYAELGFLQA